MEDTGGSRIKKSACFLKYSRISSSLTVPFSPPVPEGKAKLCGVPLIQSKKLKDQKNYINYQPKNIGFPSKHFFYPIFHKKSDLQCTRVYTLYVFN